MNQDRGGLGRRSSNAASKNAVPGTHFEEGRSRATTGEMLPGASSSGYVSVPSVMRKSQQQQQQQRMENNKGLDYYGLMEGSGGDSRRNEDEEPQLYHHPHHQQQQQQQQYQKSNSSTLIGSEGLENKCGLAGGRYLGEMSGSCGSGLVGGAGGNGDRSASSGGPMIVPVPPESDPFIVTVRKSSPNKLGKSSSSSFIGGKTSGFGPPVTSNKTGPRLALYRSNSSLDLLDRDSYYNRGKPVAQKSLSVFDQQNPGVPQQTSPNSLDRQVLYGRNRDSGSHSGGYTTGCFTRRKDFGSHGSIDVLANLSSGGPVGPVPIRPGVGGQQQLLKNERSGSVGNHGHFLSLVSGMSRDRRGSFDVVEERPGGPATTASTASATKLDGIRETASPRLKLKFQKLWDTKEKMSSSSGSTTTIDSSGKKMESSSSSGIFRVFRGTGRNNDDKSNKDEEFAKPVLRNPYGPSGEERFRRRVFAHYDCQSVSANISYAARLRGLLSKRRNTTTGASAASLGCRSSSMTVPSTTSMNNIAGGTGSASIDNASLDNVVAATTGASTSGAVTAAAAAEDQDHGDGHTNSLVMSCPYFRNEIGGEGERIVSLTRWNKTRINNGRSGAGNRTSTYQNVPSSVAGSGSLDSDGNVIGVGRAGMMMTSNGIKNQSALRNNDVDDRVTIESGVVGGGGLLLDAAGTLHRSASARGISQLEYERQGTHWKGTTCPYLTNKKTAETTNLLEAVDVGASYYRRFFYGQDHENWFGSDEVLGPLAISIKREKVLVDGDSSPMGPPANAKEVKYLYRLIVRSTELNTLRGSILEESVPGIKSPGSGKGGCHAKEVIEFLLPEIQLSCLKLGQQTQGTEDQLLKLDQQILTHRHKVGIMYCKAGQSTEEEMYNNEEAGPALNEFLDLIGERVRLKGFDKYTGGLDNKDDSTGMYSIYSEYQDCEVMFHISTLLPFTANNRQQLMRKRHIGNDIVTIVFQEPGALPFTPKHIRSQFQHVFIVVRVINPCSENTCYSVAVSRSKEVPLFGPAIPGGGKFLKNKDFVDFLISKVINAENATYRSEKFTTMATRTRQEYLKDLVNSYSSNTCIDPRPKFAMLQFGNKKKDLSKPVFNPDGALRGALSWAVYLEDHCTEERLDAYLAISGDSLVIIDAGTREPVFAIPSSSVLGWNTHLGNSSLRIYYHQGECVTMYGKESWGENEDLLEIVRRLEAVTQGCETVELSLKRNDLGQLGFHVQQDGVVTEIESCGYAAKSGLKQGSRLVEICKIVVATLNQDEMIDVLKTCNPVVVTVIPPLYDDTPRRGCDTQHCVFVSEPEGDYENLNLTGNTDDEPPSLIHHQFKAINGGHYGGQGGPKAGNHRRRHDQRSFSPPRSSNSSGYGTGSSSKSFSSSVEQGTHAAVNEGETVSSSLSGISSNEDRWYDLNDGLENGNGSANSNSPPPIPARNVNSAGRVVVAQKQFRDFENYRSNEMNQDERVGSGVHPVNETRVVVLQQNLDENRLNNNIRRGHPLGKSSTTSHVSETTFAAASDMGIYMTPKRSACIGTVSSEKVSRPYFQRNNAHHGSFHAKLSPSRSHDLLHLKSTYGLNHGLRPHITAQSGDLVSNGEVLMAPKMDSGRFHNGYDKRPQYYNSPFIENTVKGKVTYLTDFPLTHSQSTEHLVSNPNGIMQYHSPSHREMNSLKQERLALLKSTYLDKHRMKTIEDSEKSKGLAKTDRVNGNVEPLLVETNSRMVKAINQPSPRGNEVKMRTSSVNRNSANRNSTLQEDLIKLISPEFIAASEETEEAHDALEYTPIIKSGSRSNSPKLLKNFSPARTPETRTAGSELVKRKVEEVNAHRRSPEKLLNGTEKADWSSLVDSATKAFQCELDDLTDDSMPLKHKSSVTCGRTPPYQPSPISVISQSTPPRNVNGMSVASGSVGRGSGGSNISSICSSSSLLPWGEDLKQEDGFDDKSRSQSSTSGAHDSSFDLNLEARVSLLESELRKEQQNRQQLAATVANLQQENRILRLRATADSPLSNKVRM